MRLQLQDLLGLEEEKDGKYLRGAIEIIVYTKREHVHVLALVFIR